jgi:hypothetical protein
MRRSLFGVSPFVITLAFACASFAASACGPTPGDVVAWETEDGGPEKLAKVVANEKAKLEMREDAALALVRLKRRGRNVGLDLLTNALGGVEESSRNQIVAAIGDRLVSGLTDAAGGGLPSDQIDRHGVADAAYAFLSRGLVADAAAKERLGTALLKWLSEDTEKKLDEDKGRYSAEQAMRLLAPKSVRVLLPAVDQKRPNQRAVKLVAELGDPATKGEALRSLSARLSAMRGPEENKRRRTEIEEANAKSNVKATDEQISRQMLQYRSNEIQSVLTAYLEVGGDPAAAIAIANDASEPSELRATAIGALVPRAKTLDDGTTRILAAMVTKEPVSNDLVDRVFSVLSAVPNTVAVSDELARDAHWKARFVGIAIALARMKSASEISAFMERLPAKPGIAMGLVEVRYYSDEIERRFGRDALRPFLGSAAIGPRLVALVAFRGDEAAVTPAKSDRDPLPVCETCGWGDLALPHPTVGDLVTTTLMTRDGIDARAYVNLNSIDPVDARDINNLQKELLKALGEEEKKPRGGSASRSADAGKP